MFRRILFFNMAALLSDYGKPQYIRTRCMNNLLVYKSAYGVDKYFTFRKTSSTQLAGGGISDSYRCVQCEKSNARIVSRIVIRNDKIVKNPEIGHNRDCTPLSKVQVESLKIKREMKLSCQQGIRQGQQGIVLELFSACKCSNYAHIRKR